MQKDGEKMKRLMYSINQFTNALSTLLRAIEEPAYNEYVRDATIQRFEYTYETAWKAIRAVLSYQGVELRYPREMFSEAFSSGWIKDPDMWDAMIEDRNLTTHTYKERTAESVYESICHSYFPALSHLHQSLNEVIRKYVDSTGENEA